MTVNQTECKKGPARSGQKPTSSIILYPTRATSCLPEAHKHNRKPYVFPEAGFQRGEHELRTHLHENSRVYIDFFYAMQNRSPC